MKLLSRNEFRQAVFKRDHYKCVICGAAGKDAHHILERRLFKEGEELGGYFLDNGSTLCEAHHILAENTSLSCDTIRKACGITQLVLPSHLSPDYQYDKWGNILLPNKAKVRGELFYEEPVQKVIQPFIADFVKYVPYPFLGIEHEDNTIFEHQEVIILQEIRGERVVLYNDYLHGKEIEKELTDENGLKIKDLIDKDMYVCGVSNTEFHLSFIGIENEYLSWQETKEYAEILNIKTLPVLYEGVYDADLQLNKPYFIRLAKGFTWQECSKATLLSM